MIAQSQDLSSKPGVRPVAVDQGVDQEAGEGVAEGVEHDPGSVSGSGRSRLSSQQVPLSPYNRQPEVNGKRDSELTECGVTGQVVLSGESYRLREAKEVMLTAAERVGNFDVAKRGILVTLDTPSPEGP